MSFVTRNKWTIASAIGFFALIGGTLLGAQTYNSHRDVAMSKANQVNGALDAAKRKMTGEKAPPLTVWEKIAGGRIHPSPTDVTKGAGTAVKDVAIKSGKSIGEAGTAVIDAAKKYNPFGDGKKDAPQKNR
jgi:hypothetical protein